MGVDHPELRGDDIQSFADSFPDDMTLGSAGAGALGFNNHFHPFQMLDQ
ncbi:hypothetical protein [Sulfitobacter pontiacus]